MSAYVYIQSEPGLWTVGFYKPEQDRAVWHAESDHITKEQAAARVHYLNGGNLAQSHNCPDCGMLFNRHQPSCPHNTEAAHGLPVGFGRPDIARRR